MARKQSAYLALLRGINVGGKNLIAKEDLRRCFEALGFDGVRTYIQSGNVLFRSTETSVKNLTTLVEAGLADRFNYQAQAAVLSHSKYKSAVAAAPEDWGQDPAQKHNALFTLSSVTPKQVLAQLPAPQAEFETVTVGPGVIFWSASTKHLTRTTMPQLAKSPLYRQLTVRNHNTVFKLLELFRDV